MMSKVGSDGRDPMDDYLAMYPPPDSISREKESRSPQRRDPVSPGKERVERRIDLHGFTQAEAESSLLDFIRRAQRDGIRKVLVIHGKGSHAESKGALRTLTHRILQNHPGIGRMGTPAASEGGSGAVWAIVRGK